MSSSLKVDDINNILISLGEAGPIRLGNPRVDDGVENPTSVFVYSVPGTENHRLRCVDWQEEGVGYKKLIYVLPDPANAEVKIRIPLLEFCPTEGNSVHRYSIEDYERSGAAKANGYSSEQMCELSGGFIADLLDVLFDYEPLTDQFQNEGLTYGLQTILPCPTRDTLTEQDITVCFLALAGYIEDGTMLRSWHDPYKKSGLNEDRTAYETYYVEYDVVIGGAMQRVRLVRTVDMRPEITPEIKPERMLDIEDRIEIRELDNYSAPWFTASLVNTEGHVQFGPKTPNLTTDRYEGYMNLNTIRNTLLSKKLVIQPPSDLTP